MAYNDAAKKRELLGKSWGAAYPQMLKNIIFEKIIVLNGIKCMRCGGKMTREDFSIDHIENWRSANNPLESLIDSDNCGFSHIDCNKKEGHVRRTKGCGTVASYTRGCRCDPCKQAKSDYLKANRAYDPEKRKQRYKDFGN